MQKEELLQLLEDDIKLEDYIKENVDLVSKSYSYTINYALDYNRSGSCNYDISIYSDDNFEIGQTNKSGQVEYYKTNLQEVDTFDIDKLHIVDLNELNNFLDNEFKNMLIENKIECDFTICIEK